MTSSGHRHKAVAADDHNVLTSRRGMLPKAVAAADPTQIQMSIRFRSR
jgi:hypothetical protein